MVLYFTGQIVYLVLHVYGNLLFCNSFGATGTIRTKGFGIHNIVLTRLPRGAPVSLIIMYIHITQYTTNDMS